MRLIGLDPGLRNTGWGIIDLVQNKLTWIASGKISPKNNLEISERLEIIHLGLTEVLEKYNPNSAGIEEIFVNKNPQSTLKLGMARGVAITACSLKKINVNEYSPTTIKQAVTGTGKASKDQVGAMIKILLPGSNCSSDDESDALAIAICHTHFTQSNNKNIVEL
tara:strand:+ start:750 stop:1244 length:495 start_codon:yes stop_codon:yes gene_type:complete